MDPEPPIELLEWMKSNGIYANGLDAYVLSRITSKTLCESF